MELLYYENESKITSKSLGPLFNIDKWIWWNDMSASMLFPLDLRFHCSKFFLQVLLSLSRRGVNWRIRVNLRNELPLRELQRWRMVLGTCRGDTEARVDLWDYSDWAWEQSLCWSGLDLFRIVCYCLCLPQANQGRIWGQTAADISPCDISQSRYWSDFEDPKRICPFRCGSTCRFIAGEHSRCWSKYFGYFACCGYVEFQWSFINWLYPR